MGRDMRIAGMIFRARPSSTWEHILRKMFFPYAIILFFCIVYYVVFHVLLTVNLTPRIVILSVWFIFFIYFVCF